jgi:hypothetical protein
MVADCPLTELELSGDLRVVGTFSDHTEHVRLASGQTGGRFVAEDPAGRLVAENLITEIRGDDRSSDRFTRGVLQRKSRSVGTTMTKICGLVGKGPSDKEMVSNAEVSSCWATD